MHFEDKKETFGSQKIERKQTPLCLPRKLNRNSIIIV